MKFVHLFSIDFVWIAIPVHLLSYDLIGIEWCAEIGYWTTIWNAKELLNFPHSFRLSL